MNVFWPSRSNDGIMMRDKVQAIRRLQAFDEAGCQSALSIGRLLDRRSLLISGVGFALLVLGLAWTSSSQAAVLISTNSQWSYREGTNEASTPIGAWRTNWVEDGTWLRGNAPFYYDTKTPRVFTGNTYIDDMYTKYYSIFLRCTFVVTHAAEVGGLVLNNICDDGFVMWINGYEVKRHNMPTNTLTINSKASQALVATNSFSLPDPALYLVSGTNIVAVQVFNNSLTSSDLLFDGELVADLREWVPPTVVAYSPTSGTRTNLTQITVTFSEPVVGVAPEDLLINGLPAASVTGSGVSYIYTFSQPPAEQVTVSWDPEQAIADLASNRFANPLTWATYTLVDQEPPRVAQINPPAGATVRQLFQIEVKFSEPMTGVDAADLLVNGLPATALTGSASGPYVFQFAVPATGTVSFAWVPGHGIVDRGQPPNPFSGQTWTMTFDPQALIPSVSLNEFVAASVKLNRLKDEDGELQGWIELYNQGSNAVSLAGWALTDNAGAPDQWVFPDVALAPGGYLVVFASGKDRTNSTGGLRLHTNFKLNPSGEYLGLFNHESPRRVVSEFTPEFPEQRNDYSYGLDPAGVWRYYATPTPGAYNGSSSIAGVASPVHFNVERGLYRTAFQLHLSTETSNAVIRFTTDGTLPADNNGQVYTQPLLVDQTTTLRAGAFQAGMLPAMVRTHTYVFSEDVLRQPADPAGFPVTTTWSSYGLPSDYGMDPRIVDDPQYNPMMISALLGLPTLSIVMKTDDMFGAANGLYTHAGNTVLQAACSVELINPDGKPGFQIDGGIQMHGGGSRMRTMKHPFRLRFKSEFGPTKLNFPFFPDSPLAEYDTIDLRSDYNNHWTHGFDPNQRSRGQLIRDAWFKDAQAAMGTVSSHSRYVHLYINGLYWGIYNPCERPDAAFAAAYLGGKKEDYDAFNGTEPSPPVDGDATARNAMLSLSNLDNPAQYALMQQYLNILQYIDYQILQWFGANQDWGTTKNWYAFRRRQPGAGFFYMCWDNERTLEGVNENLLYISADNLQPKLAANADYRLAFADRVRKHFFNDGALTTNAVIQSWLKRAAQLDTPIVAESARWGDSIAKTALSPLPYPSYNTATPYNRNEDWLGEQGRLVSNYFPYRSDIMLNQFRAAGLYPSVAAPAFNQHGGHVPADFNLIIGNPGGSGVVYYTTNGVDPRVAVTGAVSPGARVYSDATPLRLNASAVVKSRVRDAGGNWSALNEAQFQVAELGLPVRITEIMYNPAGGSTYEFIELQNIGATPADLSRASFVGIDYIFPDGAVLAPGAVMVLIPDLNPGAFLARYPGVQIAGLYKNSLANSGERIVLADAFGRTITSVEYQDIDPWPPLAAGRGYSLELIDARGNPNDPANWRASADYGGSPGQINPAPTAAAVRLNEVMADNASAVSNAWGFSDWVEILNGGSQTANLAGWSMSCGGAQSFPFEGVSLAPGAFLVVWFDAQTNALGLHTGFALNRQGETLGLYDAASNRVEALTFGPQVADYSIGRVGVGPGEWQLTVPTPGAVNQSAAVVSSANLVINEWMANSNPGAADWLELYNLSAAGPVALKDLYLGTSNALFQFKSLAFVPARGYVRLWADEQPGGNHLDFKLPAGGGRIDLFDVTGKLLDQVVYGLQSEGASLGRLPDGTGPVVTFTASASPGTTNYLPVYSGPVLNELMANNLGIVKDNAGRWGDWIELYNPLDSPFNLSGLSLSAGEPKPGQWVFPPGTALAANDFLMVWFDGERPASTHGEANLNAGRSLSKESGGVYLFDRQGQRVDAVEYGFQIANKSIGKSGSRWQLMAFATPRGANGSPAALGSGDQLKINEWMTGGSLTDDWFEVYNPDARPVELGGLRLTDDPSIAGQAKYPIAPLSFIDGRGWVRWFADGQTSRGRDHVNFQLNTLGESLRLYNTNGTLIDGIDYDVLEAGVSEGRLPDGSSTLARFPATPTPAAANAVTMAPVITKWSQARTVEAGGEAVLSVSAYGTLPLGYQWMFQDGALLGATNASLNLTHIQGHQAGNYSVVIQNGFGSVTSDVVRLTVLGPLTLLTPVPGAGGVFQLHLVGTPGSRYIIQTSSNLMNWAPLTTNEAPEGWLDYTDTDATHAWLRFYRAIEEP